MKKILFIDDEITVKSLSKQLENGFDFEVTFLQDYSQIDNELEQGYDAIVLDVMMPIKPSYFSKDEIIKAGEKGLRTGIVLFDKIREKYPRIPIVFYTAMRERICCDENTTIIRKPELAQSIAKAINDLIERNSHSQIIS